MELSIAEFKASKPCDTLICFECKSAKAHMASVTAPRGSPSTAYQGVQDKIYGDLRDAHGICVISKFFSKEKLYFSDVGKVVHNKFFMNHCLTRRGKIGRERLQKA